MKYFIVLLLILASIIGYCQKADQLESAQFFFTILAKGDTSNIEELLEYTTISDSLLNANDGEIIKIIKYSSLYAHETLKHCNMQFSIQHSNYIDEKLLSRFDLEYADKNNVYFVICDDRIMTALIFAEKKIISFFSYLRHGETEPVIPVMLN